MALFNDFSPLYCKFVFLKRFVGSPSVNFKPREIPISSFLALTNTAFFVLPDKKISVPLSLVRVFHG